MNTSILSIKKLSKQKCYEIAEYAVALLVLIYGVKHIKAIMAFVLMELYKYLVRENMVITAGKQTQ